MNVSQERMKRQKEETLRRILDVSWEIAANEGVEAVTIRRVAKELDFAANNLYNYFENKDALYQCMKKDAMLWARDFVMKEIPAQGSILENMELIFRRLFELALTTPERYMILTSDLIKNPESLQKQEINNVLADRIEEGIKLGEIRELDPELTANSIRAMFIGFNRTVINANDISREKANEMFDNFWDIIIRGIRI